MKVTVIGGGSTYTPELVNSLIEKAKTFPMTELWLMDNNPERLAVVGEFSQRMVAAKGSPFKVILSANRREAISGSSYVLTQFRVGMMQARKEDEYLGLRHGLVGQETTGIGGMAKALRTIPVILSIAEEIRQLAPSALLVNFTNPSGLVTEALFRYAPDVNAVGLCNAPITTKMEILAALEDKLGTTIDPHRAFLDTIGLNHLSWHRGFTLDGENMWPQVISAYAENLRKDDMPEFDPQLVETLQMIPNYYLSYYYETAQKLSVQDQWPPSRAEQVMEIEKETLAEFSNPALVEPPPELMLRGGAYYSTLATEVMNSHHNDIGEIHTLNVRHQGMVEGWPPGWVLEMPCKVDAKGIHPLPANPLPPVCFGLLSQVKAYELLTVEAAVHGDRRAAYEAILTHPLGPASHKVQAVLDDMLETNRSYLPQFFKK